MRAKLRPDKHTSMRHKGICQGFACCALKNCDLSARRNRIRTSPLTIRTKHKTTQAMPDEHKVVHYRGNFLALNV